MPKFTTLPSALCKALATCCALTLTSAPTIAADWYEPARGTAERKALMDALRPHAWWNLGEPVQFVIKDLRVSGDRAFAWVEPQRPGGIAIDPFQTPAAQRDEYFTEDLDGLGMQALYWKSGEQWVVLEKSIGATEAWWAGWPYCDDWFAVIPEYCSN